MSDAKLGKVNRGAQRIPLEKLFARRERIELLIDGTKVIFDVKKPNAVVTERLTRIAELARARAKLNPEFEELSRAEANSMTIDELIETLATIDSSLNSLKVVEKLKEKYPEIDTYFEIQTQELSKEEQEKINNYITAYLTELEKETQRIIETKKTQLKSYPEETLRKRAFEEFLNTRALNQALIEVRKALLLECLYYPDTQEPVFKSIEEINQLDDAVFELLTQKVDEVANRRGTDIKKVS